MVVVSGSFNGVSSCKTAVVAEVVCGSDNTSNGSVGCRCC